LAPTRFLHTYIRVRDPEASLRFYRSLGFQRRGRLNFETAYNIYMGLPGDGDTLELTVDRDRDEPYDLGDGYNHMALVVNDLDATLETLSGEGIEPRSRPTRPAAAGRSAGSASSRTPTATGSSSSTATPPPRRTPTVKPSDDSAAAGSGGPPDELVVMRRVWWAAITAQ
jgi:lactoylglutathione lyase